MELHITTQTMSSREITERKVIEMFGEDMGNILIDGFAKMRESKHSKKTYLATDSKLYKIGRAKCPEKRIKSLQIANPALSLVHIIDSDIEKDLHAMHANKMVRKEWFDLSKKEVEYIKSLK